MPLFGRVEEGEGEAAASRECDHDIAVRGWRIANGRAI